MLKIWRSAYSRFGIHVENPDDLQYETITAEKSYTDEVLKEIAENGFNAIWIHGQLHHIVKHPRYPEFAPNSEAHLQALKTLCQRAAKYGIKVYLYMQPPRAVALSQKAFWEAHEEDGGHVQHSYGDDLTQFDVRSLCTSLPAVRQYISESFASLTRLLPELGGYILITASEYPAHCYSGRNCKEGDIRPRKMVMPHYPPNCPRCKTRQPEEVVVELIHAIRDGVRSASKEIDLIFWNWSWTMYLDPPCAPIIRQLPKDIYLLVDFERGGYRKDGLFINEYSLGYSGPSEQFLETKKVADEMGIRVLPKLQLGTTHELATVRSLPVIANLFRKADYIRKNDMDGFMGCWNFGNLLSTSTKAFLRFLELQGDVSCDDALKAFAAENYPGSDPEKILAAWHLFSEAMEQYPFTIPILYNSPLNFAIAVIPEKGPLSGKTFGRSYLPDTDRGDTYPVAEDFPLDKTIESLENMAAVWKKGTDLLQETLPPDDPDLGNAMICGALWESACNLYKIFRMRKTWDDAMTPEWEALARAELEIAERVLPYVDADKEQGWHIEGNFYCFDGDQVRKKIAELKLSL